MSLFVLDTDILTLYGQNHPLPADATLPSGPC
jgi:hypothetical protein